jgi:membrane protein implicated in regulation of membrane protease activity
MDGAKKFVLLIVGTVAVCLTVLYSFLFIALWDYRQFVALSLFAVLLIGAWVFFRGRLNEQDLRVIRYHHHVETPLDDRGQPLYWHEGFKPNPYKE